MALNISASQVASFFGYSASTSSFADPIGIDVGTLANLSSSGSGVAGTSISSSNKKYAPTAPWAYGASTNAANDPKALTAAAKAAVAGSKLIDENAAKLDLAGASTDYKNCLRSTTA
ncbi:MAG: hypothetical protein CGW95_07380 [Phenylobacterium zucineum]|nr:MAG: hypothetical protein CGW95_07380 [Phenylobacterium zucineum]